VAESEKTSVITHVRYKGETLCGFNENRLGDLPEDHKVTGLRTAFLATCEKCREEAVSRGYIDPK